MHNVKRSILESAEIKVKLAANNQFIAELEKTGHFMIACLRSKKKILMAGNGGSAADAQHFSAELAGKFKHERRGLPVMALTTNTSILTAIGNDFGYEHVFSRQIEGLGNPGDVFFGISTSGNSLNLINALKVAKNKGLITIGLLGNNGGAMKDFCDIKLIVPSDSTPHIQESHILIIHEISTLIDDAFKDYK